MTAEKKAAIREEVLRIRESLGAAVAREHSRRIMNTLAETEAFVRAEAIFAYYPIRGEVDVRALFGLCEKENKRVALPRTREDGLRFFYVQSEEELIPGRFRIPEPSCDACADEAEEALMLLPGAAFSLAGARIGYGGGYYDRYLRAHPRHFAIGLCYDFQLFEELPTGPEDVAVGAILTEKRFIQL